MNPSNLVLLAGALVLLGVLVIRVLRRRGVHGALFASKVKRTVGHVTGADSGVIGTKVKVHLLEGGSSRAVVGLEVAARSLLSHQRTPVALSATEARKLAALLETAVQERARNGR